MYHEPIGEDLDAGVAERGGGELKVAELAGEYLGGHGHEVVDHVNHDRRSSQQEQELQLDKGGRQHPA